MNYCSIKRQVIAIVALTLATFGANAQTEMPDLRVSGNQLVDPTGKAVVLHGVMDTPNRHFNG